MKKANQKRILSDMAIEGGNFTTAFFKKQTIHDLFAVESGGIAPSDGGDTRGEDDDEATTTLATTAKKSIGAFESALATAEDDSDRQATSIARAEENLDEADFSEQPEDEQFQAVLAELSGAERYALRQMEAQEQDWAREQALLAEAEIQARQEEFDADKLDELTQEIRAEMGETSEEEEEEDDHDSNSDDDVDSDDSDEGNAAGGDYAPDGSGTDDEETIARDEMEVDDKAGNPANEIHMLENEAEVPIEELLRMYYPDQLKNMLEIEVDMEEGSAHVPTTNSSEIVAVTAVMAGCSNASEDDTAERKKTRSRGAVEINLWDLSKKKQ